MDLLGTNPSPQFTTLQPASGTAPLTFDVLGDWGDTTNSGNNTTGAVNQNQAGVDAHLAASGAQFVLSTGDVAYPGGTQTEYGDLNQTGVNVSAVFSPSYWAIPGESIPYFAISGNHGLNSTFISDWPESATAAAAGGEYGMSRTPPSTARRPRATRRRIMPSPPAAPGSTCWTRRGVTPIPGRRPAAPAARTARPTRSTTTRTGRRRPPNTAGFSRTSRRTPVA